MGSISVSVRTVIGIDSYVCPFFNDIHIVCMCLGSEARNRKKVE